MGIISTVGRNSFKVRMLLWGIGTVLLLGAATMIYPFGLMIAGSSKTPVDAAENRLIPSFLTDDEAYYRKVMEEFFNEREIQFRQTYRIAADTFAQLSPPESPSSGVPEAESVSAPLLHPGVLFGPDLEPHPAAAAAEIQAAAAGEIPKRGGVEPGVANLVPELG